MASLTKLQAWPGRLSEDLAASYLSVSKSTFRIRVANGEYPQPVREGGRIYWSKIQLDAHIAMQFGLIHAPHVEDNSWSDLRQEA
jgi:predicted DNA-binding transcriptional regulator AlpA